MDQYIGKLLDNRYEIIERIGTGGMAVVYKGRDHRLNRLVAVKILKEELAQDAVELSLYVVIFLMIGTGIHAAFESRKAGRKAIWQ